MEVGNDEPELAGLLVDTHCHATDDPSAYGASSYEELARRVGEVSVGRLVCMSTNDRDQDIVAQLATAQGDKVVPCFGWHPWFAHHVSLEHPAPSKRDHYRALFGDSDEVAEIWDQLADPLSLQQLLDGVRAKFERFPHAMLGEVGIDRAFRIPRRKWDYDPEASTQRTPGPKLTKLKTPQDHQISILRAQIQLALQYRRNVSLHSVQAAGLTVDLLAALRNSDPTLFGAIRISIHSCTLDANVVRSITKLHPNVYFGFSPTVNAKQFRLHTCLEAVHRSKALLESDYHTVESIPGFLRDGVEYFAQYHNLSPTEAAKRLRKNWKAFHSNIAPDNDSDGSDSTDEDDDGPPVF